MAKKRKSETPRGEVMETAAETAKAEQYWILADKSEPRAPPKDFKYVEEHSSSDRADQDAGVGEVQPAEGLRDI